MLIQDTFNDRRARRMIAAEVGEKFSWIQRLQMGGTGSQRFHIEKASTDIHDLLQLDSKRDTCNLELRQGGLIVRFQSKMHTYAFCIPWHMLTIFKNNGFVSIYKGQSFIKATPDLNQQLDRMFFAFLLY